MLHLMISMLPLIKIPCILVATVGFHISFVEPAPPPAKEERAPSSRLEVAFRSPFLIRGLVKVGWAVAACEIAVILAKNVPSSPISKIILSNLIFANGSAERIRGSPFFFMTSFGIALGAWIRLKCYKAMGNLFTFQVTIRKDHRLITSGPYSVVRHPSYTGVIPVCLGIFLLHGMKGSWLRESGALGNKFIAGTAATITAFICTLLLGAIRRMPKEDENLHQLYGEEWEIWARKVPYKLIPWLF